MANTNTATQNVTGNQSSKDQLKKFIERIERLEEEKKTISTDIGEVYSEAKGTGYDTKTIKRIVALRKKEAHVVQEEEAMLDMYKKALGMI